MVNNIDIKKIEVTPNSIKFNCEGCKNFGKWENEVELGLPSPCTICARRVPDNFEPEYDIPNNCETCRHKNDLRVCLSCSRRCNDQYCPII